MHLRKVTIKNNELLSIIGPTAPGQQQPQAVNMTPQPGMRPQFPTPTITKQQGVGTMGGTQNTPQQLPMQHLQQAVKLPASLSQAQGQGQVFDRSGLTPQQLLSQHLLQQQMQAQNLLGQQQAARGFASQGQMVHHQLSQSAGQVAPPMQQQTVHQGLFDFWIHSTCTCFLISLNCVLSHSQPYHITMFTDYDYQ